jgi:hypothetical protein
MNRTFIWPVRNGTAVQAGPWNQRIGRQSFPIEAIERNRLLTLKTFEICQLTEIDVAADRQDIHRRLSKQMERTALHLALKAMQDSSRHQS